MTLPLIGVRVVETTDGAGEMCGRFLADLGADVVLVEPPGGVLSRRAEPAISGASLAFAVRAANKRSIELDLGTDVDRDRFLSLLSVADVWIDGHRPGELEIDGLSPRSIHPRFPQLVVASLTDFGLTGPYRDWKATDWVLFALAGQLSRSGVPNRPPFMLPGDLADETSAIQAAWAVLVALWNRPLSGAGDLLDISRFEATAQIVDPAFGSIGTAAAQSGSGVSDGRAPAVLYPIFRCLDGFVRIVVLAPRQWHGLRAWLGEPDEFSDAKLDAFGRRLRVADRLYPAIQSLFEQRTTMELVVEGQRRGVPIAPVLTPGAALDVEHFQVRGLFVEIGVGDSGMGRAPTGHVLVGGERAGIRHPAPKLGEHAADIGWDNTPQGPDPASHLGPSTRRPLAGIRVLDLGVIVMGGEAGRLFADQGADVIKVENRRFPDGARAGGMSPYFAAGQRNKRSLAIDLRAPEGVSLFERLVERSDVVLSNFKPGTLESLGIGPQRLREVNPGVVVVTSSAMGESGPWRDWMGYGPLVRCVAGLTHLWCDPEAEVGFGDSTTIYPDHFAARIVDAAALAALIRRRETGVGDHIESSQAESIIMSLGPQFLRESLEPGSARPMLHGEFNAPWGVYPCAGDDEWCVITVGRDDEWAALADVLGSPEWAAVDDLADAAGRVRARQLIDEHLGRWTATQPPRMVMERLQSAGVPAAAMAHVADLPTDPHLVAREFFGTMLQPGLGDETLVEKGPFLSDHLDPPELRPAPYYGEHTREICRELLGLDDASIDAFVGKGVLDELSESDAATLANRPL